MVAGYAVQGFSNVSCPLQDNLLGQRGGRRHKEVGLFTFLNCHTVWLASLSGPCLMHRSCQFTHANNQWRSEGPSLIFVLHTIAKRFTVILFDVGFFLYKSLSREEFNIKLIYIPGYYVAFHIGLQPGQQLFSVRPPEIET